MPNDVALRKVTHKRRRSIKKKKNPHKTRTAVGITLEQSDLNQDILLSSNKLYQMQGNVSVPGVCSGAAGVLFRLDQ